MEIFSGQPKLIVIYLQPQNLDAYVRNMTSRFILATETFNPGLPQRFWTFINANEFQAFCKSRKITPRLAHAIRQSAASSQHESDARLASLRTVFKDITLATI